MDFLLTAKRDLDTAKRFFRKMLKDEPLLSPGKIDTDGANTFPTAINSLVGDGLLHPDPVHYVNRHLQQAIESDHFRVKKSMPQDRRLPILQHGAANNRWVRSNAVAQERLWLFRCVDRQRSERFARASLRTSKVNKA